MIATCWLYCERRHGHGQRVGATRPDSSLPNCRAGDSYHVSSSCQGLGPLAAKYDPSTHGRVGNLIEEDAAAARPLIAALVVSKARGGLPAPGFFDCARRVGCFDGDPSGPEGSAFYAAEFNRAVEFWSAAADVVDQVPKFDRHPEDGD